MSDERAAHRTSGKVVRLPVPGRSLTDLGNAERFVTQHGHSVRYCYPYRAWLTYDGTRWTQDHDGSVERMAKETVRSIYAEASAEHDSEARRAIAKHARQSEASAKLKALLELARSEHGIPVQPDQLDSDPWLLNCANGTIDLRTGELCAHDPADLITKLAPVNYDGGATSDLLQKFLVDVTGGDDELSAFLRRCAGYFATGLNTEKRFFFAFGRPDTGKSTFLDALRGTLGDYAAVAAPETWLLQTHVGGNRGDLARLVGARLVMSSEFKEGAKFDESLIKGITGGDPLTCAAKYQSEFTYSPRFALLFAANDAPRIADTDAGMWARCLRVPFEQQVPEAKRDPALKRRLCDPEDTGPALLAWVVAGCLEWQQQGLKVPESVIHSTESYRRENDPIGPFFEECLVFEENEVTASSDLNAAYREWCQEEGIKFPLSPRGLAKRLQDKGCIEARTNTKRGWRGVRRRGEWEQQP